MFEWDDDKNATNIAKHGIGFERASQIFRNWVFTEVDDRFDYGETRLISIGLVEGAAVLTVVYTDRSGRIRIISARPANRAERKRYEEALQTRNDA